MSASPRPPRVFGMGGGGFTMEPENPALDRHFLSLLDEPSPRVCFMPTASGDPDEHIARFYAAFGSWSCELSHLSLFRLGREPVALREHLLAQDAIYVGGGSMRNMLAIWREHGLDGILHEAWSSGVLLAGLSAGAMCWFQAGVTMSGSSPVPEPVRGLGFLAGSACVHYDGEPERRPVYLNAVASGVLPDGYGVDDGVGLLFEGSQLVEAVSSRPRARAFRVERHGGQAVETVLETRVLVSARAGAPELAPADIAEFRAQRHGALRD